MGNAIAVMTTLIYTISNVSRAPHPRHHAKFSAPVVSFAQSQLFSQSELFRTSGEINDGALFLLHIIHNIHVLLLVRNGKQNHGDNLT